MSLKEPIGKFFTLYGWEVSPYTAKVRSYLQHKNIPFKTIAPNILDLKRTIEPRTGKMVMPVVVTPQGEMIQDSTVIIEYLEKKFPDNSVNPDTPKQYFVALLMELCGDEWLSMAALHYRWNYPENTHYILNQFGKNAFPYLPGYIQRKFASPFANKMRSYLPALGITSHMHEALETNTHKILSLLNQHFENQPYLLGSTPCIGDFSLFGPIYAHLHRDPCPDNLISQYTNILAWVNRLDNDTQRKHGNFLDNDTVPDTLLELIALIIEHQFPLINASMNSISKWKLEDKSRVKLPQKLGKAIMHIEEIKTERMNITYPYWMFQRISDYYLNLTNKDKNAIKGLVSTSSSSVKNLFGLLDRKLVHRVELERCRLYIRN